MKKMRALAAALVASTLLLAQMAEAGRTVRSPRIAWHDWLFVQQWCPSNDSKAYFKTLEIQITNLSDIQQTVTVRCNGSGMGSGSAGNPSEQLRITTQINGGSENPANSNLSISNIPIGPYGTLGMSCAVLHRGPQATAGFPGDWHMLGAFDVIVEVAEDRGALSGVVNSALEDSGCLTISPDPVGLYTATIRNVPRSVQLNGGRPF